jgi:hypothetical protein
MLDTLREYLKDATGPDMYDMLRDAHESLEHIGAYDNTDVFDDILMVDDMADSGETVSAIIATTLQMQLEVLAGHGITMTDDARVQDATRLINGIVSINSYDNAEQLMGTAALEMNSHECFAEVVALVAGEQVEDIMITLSTVNPALIIRIREIATKAEETRMSEEERSLHQRHVDEFVRFTNYINNDNLRVCAMLKNGVGPGFPFLVYANLIGRDLEVMPAEKAAHELIGMAIISADGLLSPRSVINSNIERFVADLDQITKITVIANDILLRMKL